MSEHGLRDGRVLKIKEMTEADAASAVAFCNRVGGETDNLTFGGNEFWFSVEQEAKILAAVHSKKRDVFLQGTVDGQAVSQLTLIRVERPRLAHAGELGISVRKDHWRLGIARYMCEAGIALAKQRQIIKINLKVREDNAGALALYRKLGFIKEGRISRSFLIRGTYHAEIWMGLEL